MPPSVALIAVGPAKRWMPALPIPLFLLWPVVAAAFGAMAVLRWARRSLGLAAGAERAWAVIALVCQLRGLKVDVRTPEGDRVLLWLL